LRTKITKWLGGRPDRGIDRGQKQAKGAGTENDTTDRSPSNITQRCLLGGDIEKLKGEKEAPSPGRSIRKGDAKKEPKSQTQGSVK